jgi:hypothetical protein
MFNKTLHRPMFRRGGSAGTGITSGLQSPRQGYNDPAGSVIQNDPTKVQQVGTNMEQFNQAFPQYNNTGSDFFLNLGSNILAAPGGNPILQTLGTAAKDPLLQMQKTNMANTQGNRELALKFWQSMDDDDKDAMINRAEQMVKADPERFPGGVKDALKILLPTFRKDQSPAETEREAILSEQGNTDDAIKKIGTQYELGTPDATTLNTFFENIQSGEYEGAPHDPGTFFIDDDDVARSGKDSRLVIQGYDPKQQQDYKDGRVYIDFINKVAYVKQGQFFVPYSEWSAEEISTD